MKTIIFLFFTTILLSTSCKEPLITAGDGNDCNIDPVELTDDMLFGCKVNGEPWAFQNPNLLDAIINPSINIDYQLNGSFSIGGERNLEPPCESIDHYITIGKFFPKLGSNKLGRTCRFWDRDNGCGSYRLDTLSSNNLYLSTFDTINNIAKGTFYFQALSEICNDTIWITDGRFNVTWQ